jgi:hypothetical protein
LFWSTLPKIPGIKTTTSGIGSKFITMKISFI